MIDETPGQELPWTQYKTSDMLFSDFAQTVRGVAGGQAIVRGGITVKPHVQRFATDLENEVGVSNFGTYNGHSPPEGPTQALDIFNTDNANGYILQDKICDFARNNQKKYGVRYVIRRTKIWNIERANEGWRQQKITGNRTADHYDHVHVTFYARAAETVDKPVPAPKPKKENNEGMFRYWSMDGSQRFCNHIYRSWQGIEPIDAEIADEVGEAPLKDLAENKRRRLDQLPNFPNPGKVE